MKILLLEDDYKMSQEIQQYLQNQSYDCDVVYDGLVFLKQQKLNKYSLYILDINVPSLNGIDVCKKIREEDNSTPILMLTAYSAVDDKVEALNYGADDYLIKPFHFEELLARIKALIRRTSGINSLENPIYKIADLELFSEEMKVSRAGIPINLTPKEYKLLELLFKSKGKTISKQIIAEEVWDINFETGTNTIEVYINFLRNKIDKGYEKKLIHTRPGYGYFLKEE